MSNWKIVVPEATTNKALNPSGEIAGNFGAVGGTVTRVTTYAKYGLYSYRVQTSADNQGATFTLSALANATHYVTMLVRGTLPASWDWSLDNTNWTVPTLIEQIDANWALYGASFPAAQANGSTTLRVYQNGAGSGDFYVDGVQVEEKDHWTTFCDGEQSGCGWNGAEHASTSSRSAAATAGGRMYDLQDNYHFDVGGMVGAGAAPQKLGIDSYALLPGGEFNSVKIRERAFTLSGVIRGNSLATLHAYRQALLTVLTPGPVTLRYTGATTHKEISAYYEAGLEGEIRADEPSWWERAAIRFLAPDPMWYEIGGSAAALDTNDSATMRYIVGRLRSTGQWSTLGLSVNPTTGGAVNTIAIGPDGSVYVGGNFTGWNGSAGADYVAVYNPVTNTWARVGNASDFNGEIYWLIFGPDGTLYAGGAFTNCAGVANADYIAKWNGSAWTAVGQPVQGAAAITGVFCMAFDHAGNLYIGGNFTNWADIANADYFVKWNGTSYSAVGSGGTGAVQTIAIDSQDNIYIGGEFTNWAGDGNADYLAWWNGSAWAAVRATALNSFVYTMIFTADDILYLTGIFTNAAGIANADKIVGYNGQQFFALGTGLNGDGVCLALINNVLYAGGGFTQAGPISLADRIARWNGASWAHLDVDFPATANPVMAMAVGNQDPVIKSNFDLYVSTNVSGAGSLAGTVAITNEGTQAAYPVIKITRSGGTSATLETLRNETTGLELLFNYGLLDGEELTIDLTPTQKSIVSNFFGARPDAILANSDFGQFALQPGSNNITAFVNVAGAPTITAWMEWRDAYRSQD